MDIEAPRALRLPPVEQTFTVRDTIPHARGAGYGDQPEEDRPLGFPPEDLLTAAPSMCDVPAHPGSPPEPGVSVRARPGERDVVVLDRGSAEVTRQDAAGVRELETAA